MPRACNMKREVALTMSLYVDHSRRKRERSFVEVLEAHVPTGRAGGNQKREERGEDVGLL